MNYIVNYTVATILSISLMVVSALYILVYAKKKKTNTQGDIKYKIIYLTVVFLLTIAIFMQYYMLRTI